MTSTTGMGPTIEVISKTEVNKVRKNARELKNYAQGKWDRKNNVNKYVLFLQFTI